MNEVRILVVDDEEAILRMLTTILKKEQYQYIDTARTAQEALSFCQMTRYDFIILDVMLPDRSGFEICPFIRETTDAPIVFLTACSSDLDKLSGFALGGDDYITKPFNPLEVLARMKAHLRRQLRQTPFERQSVYQYGNLRINTLSGEVYKNEHQVILPSQVYQLLLFFCQHPNQLFSKGQLYEKVWGEPFIGEDNTVMVHVRKLREKIENDPSNPQYLLTMRGLGYKFVPSGVKDERS